MITVHCWCFEYNPPVNIRRTLTLINCVQTKHQLVVKFIFFPSQALKQEVVEPFVELVVQKNWQEPVLYIMRRKVLVFYYMAIDKSCPQHIQRAVGASGRKSGGGNFSFPQGVFI